MSRSPRWWQWAEAQCAQLSAVDDVNAVDRQLETLFRESRLGHATAWIITRLSAAWNDSATRTVVQWFQRG
jgi:hypothetical protein